MDTPCIKDHWDKFLEMGQDFIKHFGDIDPTAVLVKGEKTTLVVFKIETSDQLEHGLKAMCEQEQPDYFIFHHTAWGTAEAKAIQRYPRIADMPPDDRFEVFMQILVPRNGRILKCTGYQINRNKDNIEFMDITKEGIEYESRFAFSW